jgi:N-acetylneuraminate synthase
VRYGPTESEKKSLIFRRSIYVAQDIEEGEFFTTENLRIVRPGNGAAPLLMQELIGRKAVRSYQKGQPLTLQQLF